ncbi:DUF825 domain-containing protein, partial [Mycobacterium tuberculosis]|nr:DUF825 domain-containing protein [Mycobacterium tuberculosis]
NPLGPAIVWQDLLTAALCEHLAATVPKDHDWEFFDRLSPRKRRNIINLNSGQLFEILLRASTRRPCRQ